MPATATPPRGGPLLWALLAALALASPLLAWQVTHAPGAGLALPLFDFTAFWSAGRLLLQGEDPYDPERLRQLQQGAEPGGERDVLVMWPAPWALGLLGPLAVLDAQSARAVWVTLLLAALFLALELGWRGAGGDPDRRWVAWLLAFTSVPTYFVLITGQFGPLLLLGAVGFVAALRAGRPFLAGACLALLAIKPQLAYLFWLALAVWVARGLHWRVALGAAAAVLALLAVPLLLDPGLLGQYAHSLATRNQTLGHVSPLLATALWLALDRAPAAKLAPAAVGLAWLVWYLARRWDAWRWGGMLAPLLLASFVTTVYGAWPFDLVLLYPALLACAVPLADAPARRWLPALACHLALQGAVLAQILSGAEYFWFLWVAPAQALGYAVFCARSAHLPSAEGSGQNALVAR